MSCHDLRKKRFDVHLFFIYDQIMFVVNDREVKLLSEKEQPLFLQFIKGDVRD